MMRITRHLLIGATALALAFATVACDDDSNNNTGDVVADVTPDTTADVTPDTTADVVPDTTTDVVASGACTNAADQAAIAAKDPSAVASSKGQACFLSGKSEDAEFTQCTKEGVMEEVTGITGGCADCYAVAALCAKNNCLAECLGTPEACSACRETAGCNAPFYTCSGLTPPASN
ncbi:MAG: hypothetical protein R3F39_10105 [Myxococcota bacterium]